MQSCRIAPAEVRGMDPLQRQILEVGYAALFDAGQTSKSLLPGSYEIGSLV